VDYDGDGHLDLVSGSYDPGELYLFRGLGHGRFAGREVIKDRSGKPILKVPNQKDRVESFGSWMALVDWDDDGDMDILVGTFDGMIFLRRNEGTRTRPAYSPANEWVKAGNKVLRVPGGEHANPVAVDWDGDGRWDIVTGSGEGGVYWYRNVGGRGRPEFDRPVALVPKHEGIGYGELLEPGHDPKPGIRSQVAVADHDGDGKLDLLIGDFCTYTHIKKDLSPAQRQELEKVRGGIERAGKSLRGSMEDLRARFKAMMNGRPQSDWFTPESNAKWQKMYQEMRDSKPYKERMSEYERLEKEMEKFVERPRGGTRSSGPDVPHGYVWLFRRRS
jgi:hypothetical protein